MPSRLKTMNVKLVWRAFAYACQEGVRGVTDEVFVSRFWSPVFCLVHNTLDTSGALGEDVSYVSLGSSLGAGLTRISSS